MDSNGNLRLAIPSDGALYEPTQSFLRSCGIGVSRSNLRRYTAGIPALPGVNVLFQRGADITPKVEEGSADIGVVGLDRYLEMRREGGDTNVIIDDLGFGQCQLVIGVPDSWVDVTSLADLADLSMEFRQNGGDLRIVTKYPRLVERFLLSNGVNFFSLVHSSGTLEAAPAMGFADIIVDVSESGTTMRENRLKTIAGGSIIVSKACVIGNKRLLREHEGKLDIAKSLVDVIEAYLKSRNYFSVTANMRGETPGDVAKYILEQTDISGLRGPTISKVYTSDGQSWFAVTVIVEQDKLLGAVSSLRKLGGSSVTVSHPNYVFHSECKAHERLV
ncbi:MAG: ATP phosphoribosyltransferase [SAR202 cluster bacterium Casp-Chloro-G4]|nr:ATP phosphoribosyltransferase [Chloroflexota bacterium]MDA1228633.1 ATP phosphoribosyltransferase [Chloroflexota bacterium]PKB61991.1 MAG: ATP phosphoribosyltransferase [SAR202 cluster bacterium Casp-Chloro-G4]